MFLGGIYNCIGASLLHELLQHAGHLGVLARLAQHAHQLVRSTLAALASSALQHGKQRHGRTCSTTFARLARKQLHGHLDRVLHHCRLVRARVGAALAREELHGLGHGHLHQLALAARSLAALLSLLVCVIGLDTGGLAELLVRGVGALLVDLVVGALGLVDVGLDWGADVAVEGLVDVLLVLVV